MSSLRPLNRDPKYMTGDYLKMFDIESIPSNKHFVSNPYKPGSCKCNDNVCFSLSHGAVACRPDATKTLVYNAEGRMVEIPSVQKKD